MCYLDVMCKSGYCADNDGGARKGQCATKNSAGLGESCYNGVDDICQGSFNCALNRHETCESNFYIYFLGSSIL